MAGQGDPLMPDIRLNPLFNTNPLKLGTFGTNGRGASHSVAPDAHRPTWPINLEAAQLADRAGFEALVAFARWKGFADAGIDHPSGVVLDPFIWAGAIAQATSYSAVFATTHAPTVHPIVVAKQTATIDIISGGRLGLNLVGGWNKPEFDMFGAALAPHDERYEHLDEWYGVLQRLWTAREEFDFEGRFLCLTGAMSRPQPLQQPRPAIMNAGGSGRGMQFACQHADMCFVSLDDEDADVARRQIDAYKRLARDVYGREVGVWTVVGIVQRDTVQQAEDYLHYFAVEHEDSASVEQWIRRTLVGALGRSEDYVRKMRVRVAAASGSQLLVGTAQHVADGLERLHGLGIDGCLLAWNDFADGLTRFNADVLPILEARGLRAPFAGR
jgi:FMNH2-dependent dimethyl sulfone monooxygenase